SVDLPKRESADIRNQQLMDPEIAKIVKDFETVPLNETASGWTQSGYIMSNGILYRYDSESEEAQRVVPKHERQEILREYHDSPTACHDGAERTLLRIKNKYYWTVNFHSTKKEGLGFNIKVSCESCKQITNVPSSARINSGVDEVNYRRAEQEAEKRTKEARIRRRQDQKDALDIIDDSSILYGPGIDDSV
ncbi:hypothetical protein CBL_20957, partial [Carabus blaptoides fortunei]